MTDLGELIKYGLEKGIIKKEDLGFAFFLNDYTSYYPLEPLECEKEPEWPKNNKMKGIF